MEGEEYMENPFAEGGKNGGISKTVEFEIHESSVKAEK
jgi:hypothetical protein